MMRTRPFSIPTQQRGMALLIVLVIVALASIIAVQLQEQNRFSQRRTQLMLGKQQAYQLALGGEELSRIWLSRGFGLARADQPVHLNQAWATTPLEFPIEGGMIRATVTDAQSCFNLNTLGVKAQGNNQTIGPGTPPSRVAPESPGQANQPTQPQAGNNPRPDLSPDRAIFIDLLQSSLEDVEISADAINAAVVDWIDADIEPTGGDGAEDFEYTGYSVPYRTANHLMASKTELRVVKGVSAAVYDSIKQSICVLPDDTINEINVNTINENNPQLLKALLKEISLADATAILAARKELPEGFDDDSFWQQIDEATQRRIPEGRRQRLAFTSNYFFVNMSIEYRGAIFNMGSLMQRSTQVGQPFTVVARYFGDY